MNYELAKSLKDAGFPQFGDGNALVLNFPIPESDQTVTVIPWSLYVHNPMPTKEVMYGPTLSELIEACGDNFLMFEKRRRRQTEHYDAAGYRGDGQIVRVEGATAQEAVARLWLALHPMNETHQGENRPTR